MCSQRNIEQQKDVSAVCLIRCLSSEILTQDSWSQRRFPSNMCSQFSRPLNTISRAFLSILNLERKNRKNRFCLSSSFRDSSSSDSVSTSSTSSFLRTEAYFGIMFAASMAFGWMYALKTTSTSTPSPCFSTMNL